METGVMLNGMPPAVHVHFIDIKFKNGPFQ